jgi:thiamine biosynthesis lipoprotein
MKETRLMMGMPITIEMIDSEATEQHVEKIYDYFSAIDAQFSTYKADSEIAQLNAGKLKASEMSMEMKEVFRIAEETRKESNGFFDIHHNGKIDPSGIVKGWAIGNAAKMLQEDGFRNFYVDAGGDVQTGGKNSEGENWRIGIRNPFNRDESVKIVSGDSIAVATSGTAIRGQHIYNPLDPARLLTDVVSLTIVGDAILDVDRFATAAFAMGTAGISFVESLAGFEGYMIDKNGMATYTSNFEKFVV